MYNSSNRTVFLQFKLISLFRFMVNIGFILISILSIILMFLIIFFNLSHSRKVQEILEAKENGTDPVFPRATRLLAVMYQNLEYSIFLIRLSLLPNLKKVDYFKFYIFHQFISCTLLSRSILGFHISS